MRTVVATRCVTALREGGSLPGLVEADDDRLYFVKLVAPASTIIQASEVQTGFCDDPAAELEHLVATLVD